MSRLLAENAEFVDYASYQGSLYNIDSYPGVVPSGDPTHQVHGEVYRLADADRLLACLDRYEECGPEFPDPTEYRRQEQDVQLDNGDPVKAWVYVYNRSTAGLEFIESNDCIEK